MHGLYGFDQCISCGSDRYASACHAGRFHITEAGSGFKFCARMAKSTLSGIPVPQSVLYGAVPMAGVCMLLMQSERFFLFILKKQNKIPQAYLDLWAQQEAERKAEEERNACALENARKIRESAAREEAKNHA